MDLQVQNSPLSVISAVMRQLAAVPAMCGQDENKVPHCCLGDMPLVLQVSNAN